MIQGAAGGHGTASRRWQLNRHAQRALAGCFEFDVCQGTPYDFGRPVPARSQALGQQMLLSRGLRLPCAHAHTLERVSGALACVSPAGGRRGALPPPRRPLISAPRSACGGAARRQRCTPVQAAAAMEAPSGLIATCALLFAGAFGCGLLPRLVPVSPARLGTVSCPCRTAQFTRTA